MNVPNEEQEFFDDLRTKKAKATRELQNIANIENAFKELGRKIYETWLNEDETYDFETIMEFFHSKLTKLEEAKNDTRF
jgi:hypothetical protein